MCRQVDRRDAESFTDLPRRLHAIHLALDADVHHHQVWLGLLCLPDRLFTGGNYRRDRISQVRKDIVNILRGDPFILHDHDSSSSHRSPPAWNVSAIRIPDVPFITMVRPNWSARVLTNLSPSDFVLPKPTPSGRPTPSSLTSKQIRPHSSWRISIRTTPVLSPGNAYFKLLETNSFTINPHGTAVSIGRRRSAIDAAIRLR